MNEKSIAENLLYPEEQLNQEKLESNTPDDIRKAEDPSKREIIRLLTYNLFIRPPPIKTNLDDYKTERLDDFCSYLKVFDIICFEEMFGAFHSRKHKIIKEAAENGFPYHVSSSSPSILSKCLVDGGLLLLSRYPIIESEFVPYDYCVMGDAVSMKGIIYAKIEIKNNYLFLFSTHLQASYLDISKDAWACTVKTRTEQTKHLVTYMYNKIKKIDSNTLKISRILLCGDFNIDANETNETRMKFGLPMTNISEYDSLMKKLQKLGYTIDLIKKKFGKHPPTFGVNDEDFDQVLTGKIELNTKQAIDYIFEIKVKETINQKNDYQRLSVLYDSVNIEYFKIKNRPYQQLSDHFGVSVELGMISNNENDIYKIQ